MNVNKTKKQIFHSMMEVEKELFPKSFKKNILEKLTDARALGINLAKESLGKIMGQLANM